MFDWLIRSTAYCALTVVYLGITCLVAFFVHNTQFFVTFYFKSSIAYYGFLLVYTISLVQVNRTTFLPRLQIKKKKKILKMSVNRCAIEKPYTVAEEKVLFLTEPNLLFPSCNVRLNIFPYETNYDNYYYCRGTYTCVR